MPLQRQQIVSGYCCHSFERLGNGAAVQLLFDVKPAIEVTLKPAAS